MKRATALISILGLALCGSMAAAADSGTRVLTAFGGKPPFKRQVVTAEVADTLARDAAARRSVVPAAGDRVHVAQLRARPPFERRIVTVSADNAVEFARFEEVEPRPDTGRRVGPPGKGFR
jgi:hypothetical protein